MAAGLSLVFYDAGAPHVLPEPRVLQTVVLPYAGTWPEVEPLRLVVEAGTELGARREGNVVRVAVPAGEQVRAAVSSSLPLGPLDVLGLWRTYLASPASASPADQVAKALLARAAADGWFWWLTPAHHVRLVHPVAAPVRPPQLPALKVLLRPPGLTVAALVGVVDVHGASTERLVVEASWSEWVDVLADDGPRRVDRRDVVVSAAVQPDERFGLLHLVDAVLGGEDDTAPVVSQRAIQTFPRHPPPPGNLHPARPHPLRRVLRAGRAARARRPGPGRSDPKAHGGELGPPHGPGGARGGTAAAVGGADRAGPTVRAAPDPALGGADLAGATVVLLR